MLYYSCLSDAHPEVPRQHLWGKQTDLKPGYTDSELLSRVERKLKLSYPYSEHRVFKAIVSTSAELLKSGWPLGKV